MEGSKMPKADEPFGTEMRGGLTPQMQRDLAAVKVLGFDNLPSPGAESRGSAAGSREDVLRLVNATTKTSDTEKIQSGAFGPSNPYKYSTEDATERARKQVGGH